MCWLVGSRVPNSMFDLVQAAARRFRRALEEGGLEWESFRDFPRGSCGDTSELLGEYLRDCGLGDWTYVSGIDNSPGGFYTHAWLKRDEIYVDITGDQFDECDDPVVVTYSPLWQDRFGKSADSHIAGLMHFDAELVELRRDYQTLRFRADAEDLGFGIR